MSIEAMKQAWEELEEYCDNTSDSKYVRVGNAKNALRQALAQPEQEQEPESWMGISDNPYCNDADCNDPNGRAMRWHKKLLELRGQKRKDLAQPKNPDDLLTQSEKEAWGYAKECETEMRRLKQVNQKLTQTLTDLVEALKNTRWSFWQSTRNFRDQFERARIRLALLNEDEKNRDCRR